MIPSVKTVVLAFAGALALTACSSDTTSTSGTGTPPTSDAGTQSTGDSGSSGTVTKLNGCDAYTDGNTITWDLTSKPPATCLKVKKGGTVTFNGSFSTHPLLAQGGDSPSPFTGNTSGTSATIKFDNVGTFGFICGVHSFMTGAIEVVP